MAIRSRRNTSVDLGRLVAGIRGPNVDTRLWKVLAYATADSFIDKDHGVFVDVRCFPGGEEFTCRVGSDYVGNEWGFYTGQIKQDDELEVSIPLGDPAEGPVVSRRLWSAADLPPKQAVDNEEDVVLVVEKDKNLRFYATGDGKIMLGGDDEAEEKIVIGSTFREKQKSLNDSLKSKFGDLSSALDDLKSALSDLGNDINTLGSGLTFAGVLIPAAAAAMKVIASTFGTQGSQHASSASSAAGDAKSAADGLKDAVSQFEDDAGDNQDFLSDVGYVAKK